MSRAAFFTILYFVLVGCALYSRYRYYKRMTQNWNRWEHEWNKFNDPNANQSHLSDEDSDLHELVKRFRACKQEIKACTDPAKKRILEARYARIKEIMREKNSRTQPINECYA